MATASPASAPSAHPLAAEPEFAVVNGDFLPLAEARISVLDLGFLRGLGVFETLRTYGGLPHALARHLDRLHASALATLDLRMEQLNLDQLTLRRHIARAHTLCRSELRINLLVTPGELRRGVFGADAPTTVLLLRPLHEPPRSWYEDGVGVTTFAGGRICPEFKTTAYITGRKGLLAAEAAAPATMLHAGIRDAYDRGIATITATKGVSVLGSSAAAADRAKTQAKCVIFKTDLATFQSQHQLSDEVFGPSSILIEANTREELEHFARNLEGHLTATIHGTPEDLAEYASLVRILERKVGRIVFNGFPTGVEVAHATQHGGPYPASLDAHWTSIGSASIYRFVRPICYQGFPDAALPAELKNANPRGMWRVVDGVRMREGM